MLAVALALLAQLQPDPNLAGPNAPGDPTHAHPGTPAAARVAHDERLKLLVMDLAAEGNVDIGVVNTLTGILTAELADYPDLDVVANADVRRMLELEGEKQMVGCGDTSCLADIAGAMGARLVVFGSVGQLGEVLIVHLNLYDSVKAQSVGRQFLEVKDLSTLSTMLRPKLRTLLERTYADAGLVLPRPPPDPPAPAPVVAAPVPRDPGVLPWVLVGGGAVAVIGGSVAAVVGAGPWFAYQDRLASFDDARADDDVSAAADHRTAGADQAAAWNSWGLPTTIAGGALVVGGIVSAGVGAAMIAYPGVE